VRQKIFFRWKKGDGLWAAGSGGDWEERCLKRGGWWGGKKRLAEKETSNNARIAMAQTSLKLSMLPGAGKGQFQ